MTTLMWTTTDTAEALGMTASAFRSKKKALEADDFPKPVPVLSRYVAADVRAWVNLKSKFRNTSQFNLSNGDDISPEILIEDKGVNHENL
ncbi:hypothetical protein [Pacificibacter marinus]|uniref:Prophage CP4-57 regulatory protein (AlpA) n=1 Tax=Pacificibacter marinus TaxID=658057 RepID=A0A1Y5SMB8_9RHOB|nr:hypothetical protein [Pacificibacter marinus]SEK72384.1 hypothetical protein SAMN04488032_105230 [Pacificibacter marinus]SLN43851.1 hypothetical protein PAM7971_02096 [Pacificibacter marinus]